MSEAPFHRWEGDGEHGYRQHGVDHVRITAGYTTSYLNAPPWKKARPSSWTVEVRSGEEWIPCRNFSRVRDAKWHARWLAATPARAAELIAEWEATWN